MHTTTNGVIAMWSAPRIHTSCSCRILAALRGGGSAVLDPPEDEFEARSDSDDPLFAGADEAAEGEPGGEPFRPHADAAEPRQEPVLRRGLISIWPAFREPE